MKKIRLSDTDLELFDLEINPSEFIFFSRHKEAFRCMWKEQGETFWKKFTITFRSFTNRHGVIKEISNNSPKFEDFVDQAFIFIHENFVEGREGKAKNFIEDIAKLAQNRERFRDLDSKSFAKDPFYMRDTRDLFRRFFGPPDQKSSYLKVYVVSPIYLRFGGSVCRCLRRWLDAPTLDDGDESYWVPPEILINGKENRSIVIMCERCLDDCSTKYFREKLNGKKSGPSFISFWLLGDPRFNDEENPLYAPYMDESSDWRETLSADQFRDFLHYAKFKYGSESDKCQECLALSSKKGDPMDSITVAECKSEGQKKKKKRKKKNKAKPVASNVPDDIDDLVAHIQGERELICMPVSTFAGARSPDVVIPIQPREEKWHNKPSDSKKNAFADKINVIEDFKSGILQATDDIPTNSRIGGFDVVRITDEITGASELKISVKALEGEEGRPPRPRVVKSQNSFPLSAKVIKSHLVNLPEKTEWYEGDGWCACELNYSVEEKENPTHFAIKVSGPDEDTTKRTMLKLLFYVSRRKNRPCPGWCMDDDDVVACILPDDCPYQEGLTISIIKEFSFEERLTEEEISSMNKDDDVANQTEKVLVTIRGDDVKQLLQKEPGERLLKRLLFSFGRNAVNGSTGESIDLTWPFIDEDDEEYAQPIWNQIKQEPEKFEIFFKVPKENETDLNKLGFHTIDRAFFDKDPMNEIMLWERVFCLRCKRNRRVCTCGPFRKFIELDSVGKKPFPLSAGEDMDLKIEANDKKPAFEEILSREFENHVLIREKQQQKLNDMKTKMMSVEEVDEEIVREEIIDSLKNVFSGEKFPNNLNPDFMENVNSEENLEVSHEDDKEDTFMKDNDEKESTDKVNEAQLMTDAKVDEVYREEDLPVTVNENRELGNIRNLEEKGKENDQVLKMDEGENANANWTEEDIDVSQNEETVDDKDGEVLENLKNTESIEIEKTKLEGDNSSAEEEEKSALSKMSENPIKDLVDVPEIEKLMAEVSSTNMKEQLATSSENKTNGIEEDYETPGELKNAMQQIIDNSMETPIDPVVPYSDSSQFQETILDNVDHNKTQEENLKDSFIIRNGDMEQEHEDVKTSEQKLAGQRISSTEAIPDCLERTTDKEMDSSPVERVEERKEKGTGNLRRCSSCKTEEPAPKAYKKCLKCKQEGIISARYYCGKNCQTADWKLRHKDEHKRNLLD